MSRQHPSQFSRYQTHPFIKIKKSDEYNKLDDKYKIQIYTPSKGELKWRRPTRKHAASTKTARTF